MSASLDHRINRALAGDRQSVAELLEEFGPVVREQLDGIIPKKWQSVLSMDDLMQQTYTAVFLNIRSFESRGEGSFAAWLSTVARNTLYDALRMLEADKRGGNYRRVELPSGEEPFVVLCESLATTSSTPSRYAARHEAREAMERAILALPTEYQKLVRMYDIEGRPAAEVAAALHRSIGAMYMLRARAHRHLAAMMGTASQFLSRST